MKSKLLQSLLVLVFAVQPSLVKTLAVPLMVWTMWLGRLFQATLATSASTTGKKEVTHSSLLSPAVSHTINVHTVLTMLISYHLSSSCGSDGSRNCLVSKERHLLLFPATIFHYLPSIFYFLPSHSAVYTVSHWLPIWLPTDLPDTSSPRYLLPHTCL